MPTLDAEPSNATEPLEAGAVESSREQKIADEMEIGPSRIRTRDGGFAILARSP
jgi:hypothetical protein